LADPKAEGRGDEARHCDVTAPRVGCKLRLGLHSSSADRFGASSINNRYFDRSMKVLRRWDAHFLARPAYVLDSSKGDVTAPGLLGLVASARELS
jgi:hypothetical protein